MREFLEQLINRIREFWGQQDLTRRIGFAAICLFVILLIIFAVFWLGKDNYVTLYAGLTRKDMGRVGAVLSQNGIDYKINEKYNEILVPIDKYDEAQIRIAERDAISGAASAIRRTPGGYEILERGSLNLMSDKEFEEFKRQALEGEIAYTLASFEGVRSATVGLALPKHELFVKDQKEPSASVLLTLELDGFDGKFDSKVIPIMQKIAAYRVPGLKPENVHIADTEGLYDSSELAKKDIPSEKMLRQLEIVKEYERYYRTSVRRALQKYEDKIASIEVKVDVDLTQKSILEEEFTPVTEEEGLPRSSLEERESFEGQGILPGGVPGVSSNVPPEYMGVEAVGPSTYDRSKRIDNYEMNRTVTEYEEVIKPPTIVSASVLVDLSLQQEIDSIRNIIAKTLNVTDEKIAIEATSFPVKAVEILKEAKPVWFTLIQMGIIALTVIAILLFLRSMIRRKEEVVEAPKVAEEGIPSGMTVREFVDQQLEERISLFERERAEEEEKERELEIARKEAEEEERRKREEEEERRKAEEEAKLREEEEKRRVTTEQERRKEVLDEIRKFAQENPEAIAEVLKIWLQPPEESQDRSQRSENQPRPEQPGQES